MSEKKANQIVEKARELARQSESWADFSNLLSDPEEGLIAKTYPKVRERQAFFSSPQYEEINQILLGVIQRCGLVQGAVPKKSGKFVVRVPKSVHQALEIEANQEGVSLNQLASSKLAVSLKGSIGLTTIVEAFRQVHDGYSPDRIVVDPHYNTLFLQRCRGLGLTQSDYHLNHALFDVRKSKKVLLPPTTKATKFTDYDDYEFASEIAFRHLQRKEGIPLDRVLCDPVYRAQFDEIARQLAPNQPVLKLRCAALNLRKTHRLRPLKGNTPTYDLVSAGSVARINLDEVPAMPGMYVFYDEGRPIFAGETARLRARISHHLEHSHAMGLPEWLEIGSPQNLELKYIAIPSVGREGRLNWLMQFVNRERPILNYQNAA
jgi:site-specific DNA-methyltransferase (adenine-specific)